MLEFETLREQRFQSASLLVMRDQSKKLSMGIGF